MNILKKSCACGLVASLLFGTGCAVQVRDRAYLQAIELTLAETYTVQIHDFETVGAIATGNGKSVEAALSVSAAAVGKELFLGHLELIAYTDPACSAQLDAWMETYRLSPACQVLGLTEENMLEQSDTLLLMEQLQYLQENGLFPQTDLYTILREFAGASGTALLPFLTDDGFSAAIVTDKEFCGNLSADAIAGLCWLRGDAFPTEVTLSEGETFSITLASVRLLAQVQGEVPCITISVCLKGDGDFEEAARIVTQQCETAINETFFTYHADVFDIESCLKSQCYSYTEGKSWEEIADALTFVVQVNS